MDTAADGSYQYVLSAVLKMRPAVVPMPATAVGLLLIYFPSIYSCLSDAESQTPTMECMPPVPMLTPFAARLPPESRLVSHGVVSDSTWPTRSP